MRIFLRLLSGRKVMILISPLSSIRLRRNGILPTRPFSATVCRRSLYCFEDEVYVLPTIGAYARMKLEEHGFAIQDASKFVDRLVDCLSVMGLFCLCILDRPMKLHPGYLQPSYHRPL